jgi:hypothetical protein
MFLQGVARLRIYAKQCAIWQAFGKYYLSLHSEHRSSKPMVAGSIPAGRATFEFPLILMAFGLAPRRIGDDRQLSMDHGLSANLLPTVG